MTTKTFVMISMLVVGLASFGCRQVAERSPSAASTKAAPSTVRIKVTATGYEPASVTATADQPLTLVFRRTTDEGCGTKLVLPDHKIERDLPLNQDVSVSITPKKNERISFTCGMGMYKGSIVAKS